MKTLLRFALPAIGFMVLLASPARADLGAARSFAVLSGGDRLQIGSDDSIVPVPNPTAATCPAGSGCTFYAGGTSVTKGVGGSIQARITRNVKAAGLALASYSATLAALTPTDALGAITVGPSSGRAIKTVQGLNVITIPWIEAGAMDIRKRDPCLSSTQQPPTIEIYGTSTSTVVFNIGTASQPGFLLLCAGAKIVLEGGITPDRVTFNVEGTARRIVLGIGTSVSGTILAPSRGVYTESGSPVNASAVVVNGAILANGGVILGNDTNVNFYPQEQIGVPATITYLGTVDVRKLKPAPPWNNQSESDEFLTAPPIQAPFRAVQRDLFPTTLGTGNTAAAQSSSRRFGPNLTQLVSFSGLSQNGKVPPDAQIAAGAQRLIEMVNVTGAVYTNPGGTLIKSFDLGQFFLGSQGQGTDPRVYYDPTTKNFFAAYELKPSGGDDIRLAIASDPGNVWAVYDVQKNSSGITFDQPKLGVGTDKITLSWNNYGSQSGTDYIVIQKAGIVSRASTVPGWIWGPDTSRFQVVPANSLTPDRGIQYAGWRGTSNSNIDVMAFTGVPGVSSMNYTDTAYGIGSISGPPPGRQPKGGDPTINTNDSRLLSTAWQNGLFWGNFNEGCTPRGDSTTRACERYVEVSTNKNAVLQNVQLQQQGDDFYYSAVTLDGGTSTGDLFFGITESSSSIDPQALALGVPGGSFTSSTSAIVTLKGTRAYAACTSPCPRWGDYSGAARDPNNPNNVWLVNEYGGLSSPGGFWGTAITEIHI